MDLFHPNSVRCQACKQWEWNFNLVQHYKCEHGETPMNTAEKDISKEIENEFAQQHIEKMLSVKSRGKSVRKREPKAKSRKKPKTQNRIGKRKPKKQSRNALTMLMSGGATKKPKKRKKSVVNVSLSDSGTDPIRPRKRRKTKPKQKPSPLDLIQTFL